MRNLIAAVAVDAYGIESQSDASDASNRPISDAAAYAGIARITARASTGPAAVSIVYEAARRSSVARACSVIVPGGSAAASVSASSPVPPGSDTNAP